MILACPTLLCTLWACTKALGGCCGSRVDMLGSGMHGASCGSSSQKTAAMVSLRRRFPCCVHIPRGVPHDTLRSPIRTKSRTITKSQATQVVPHLPHNHHVYAMSRCAE